MSNHFINMTGQHISGHSCCLRWFLRWFGCVSCVSLPFLQTYTAVYYVMADIVMLALYFYYKIKNRVTESEYFGWHFDLSFPNAHRRTFSFVQCHFQCLVCFIHVLVTHEMLTKCTSLPSYLEWIATTILLWFRSVMRNDGMLIVVLDEKGNKSHRDIITCCMLGLCLFSSWWAVMHHL